MSKMQLFSVPDRIFCTPMILEPWKLRSHIKKKPSIDGIENGKYLQLNTAKAIHAIVINF